MRFTYKKPNVPLISGTKFIHKIRVLHGMGKRVDHKTTLKLVFVVVRRGDEFYAVQTGDHKQPIEFKL